ncbi:enoyl-CoA hydratase-related protein [Pseudomonas sp. Z18(2022)]|uniref:enoyl-CoA hydratase-related protein n=1 Tax=Pseudomonas sp. Z18(2022) TaxID=2983410 RepID=UPI002E8153E9|nr:enoyl-CoA hydratase-related protein [Pseudomonas sp. Z18(2022)]
MSGHIKLERAGNVARLVLDNPGKHNAMNRRMWVELSDHMSDLSNDTDLRCIILTGAGDKAFGSGGDIDEFETERGTRAQAEAFGADCHKAMSAVMSSPVPTLAAIKGICVGGGLELAAHCDLRIARSDSRFAIPIARLGAVLAYPEMQGLLRLVSSSTALELLLEARTMDANEAMLKGLVNRVISAEVFDEELEKTVERIVNNAPMSARTHKRFIERLRSAHLELSVDELAEGYVCFDSKDYAVGYRSFLAKTRAQFQGN